MQRQTACKRGRCRRRECGDDLGAGSTPLNPSACAENLSHQVSARCAIPTGFVDDILARNQRRFWRQTQDDGNQVFSVILKTPSPSVKKPQLTDSPESQFKSVPLPSPYAYQNVFPLLRAFSIGRVCVVADRGMISATTIEGLEARKLEYILRVRRHRAQDRAGE
jgi:hypothetical protein